ncbi:probable protein phosphatase 2C 74 [Malania oleifera]|uniref:probable protein phosphatase 2C 74 n=1 Tax=Malania oleifera TaxID=397392 RepID=UPI0025ADB660|nr:probable protein phosphatase 2C 74 [Malania oleifera]
MHALIHQLRLRLGFSGSLSAFNSYISLRVCVCMAALTLKSPQSYGTSASPSPPSLSRLFAGEHWGGPSAPLFASGCHAITREEEFCGENKVQVALQGDDGKMGSRRELQGLVRPMKKRPARIVIPEFCPGPEFRRVPAGGRGCSDENGSQVMAVEGRDFFVACKKGRREVMEDGYSAMVDILGDPNQAFFAVIDGHGGRAAADYVAENLGKNIMKAVEHVGEEGDFHLEKAIRGGYLATDKEFLSQGVCGGACVASVLFKDGEAYVANVGDCKVVVSRKGVANALTNDHRVATREDERLRIESSGAYVHCHNGVWRVQGSLAISRAIGDLYLKEWIISEPEITKFCLTSECQFLIVASDGLWDKVKDQEAVDMVLQDKYSLESSKKLVDASFNRGNKDDITVMIIDLQKFMATSI